MRGDVLSLAGDVQHDSEFGLASTEADGLRGHKPTTPSSDTHQYTAAMQLNM